MAMTAATEAMTIVGTEAAAMIGMAVAVMTDEAGMGLRPFARFPEHASRPQAAEPLGLHQPPPS